MPLSAGARFGPYEILAPLGAGAMGEVWRARDPRLGREIALKILPAAAANDRAARARMLREARLAATLNHPNVCTVHEVGEALGHVYLALELVDGRPLSSLIEHRPMGLPTENVLGWGGQIADALAHAHERQVVHRDLKAANVMVTPEGRVKVLDFGVARFAGEASGPAGAESTAALTRTGAVVGTPAYLAPEVLHGGEADERSDVWSLGVLLFAMAGGALPFRGPTPFALASAILHDPPAALPDRVPAGLRAVIARCLAKQPGERYRRASEVRAALDALAPGATPAPGGMATGAAPYTGRVATGRLAGAPPRWALAAMVGAGLLALLLAARALLPLRHELVAPRDLKQRQLISTPIELASMGDISPDGRTVAVADLHGLTLRSVETGESHPVPLPAGFVFTFPFVSVDWFPDGSAVLVCGHLPGERDAAWALPVTGGRTRKVLDDATFANVSPDGARLSFVRHVAGGAAELWVAGRNGEDARRVARDDSSGVLPLWGAWSPDSRRLAYARFNPAWGTASPRLESCDLTGHSRIVYTPPANQSLHFYTVPLWLPDGRMLFGLTDPPPNERDLNLWSLRVDPATGRGLGAPRRVTQWQRVSLVAPTAVSADGRRLTVGVAEYQSDVFVGRLPAAGRDGLLSDVRRVTLDERMDLGPAWLPDDSTLVFASDRNGSSDLFRQPVDGAAAVDAEPLVTGPGDQYAPEPTADGAWLLYKEDDASAHAAGGSPADERLMRIPLAGGHPEKVLDLQGLGGYRLPRVRGAPGVLCEPKGAMRTWSAFDPVRGRGNIVLSIPGSSLPVWDLSPDGRSIALVTAGRDSIPDLEVLPVEPDPTVRARGGSPARVVRLDRAIAIQSLAYAADGRSWFAIEAGEKWRLLRIEASGRTSVLTPPQLWMYSAAPSPDGRRIAYTSNTGQNGLWLLEDF